MAGTFSYKHLFSLFAESQDARIYDRNANTSGPGAVKIHEHVSLQGGYAYLRGGEVWKAT